MSGDFANEVPFINFKSLQIGYCKEQKLSRNRPKRRHEGSYNARIDYSLLTAHEKVNRMKKYPTVEESVRWFAVS